MRSLRHSTPRLALAGLAVAALLTIGGTASQAADPFVAGGRSTRPLPAAQDDLARARARGQALAAALGLAGVSQRAERLVDAFEHRTYDEVTSVDAAGRAVAIARFELDGSVAMAVSLGWQPGGGRAIDGSGAASRAITLARSAGLSPAGQPTVRSSAGAGGWSVTFPRIVGAVPVRGDGIRVALWPDGTFHGLTRTERPLAAPPARPIDAGAARAAAATIVTATAGRSATSLGIVSTELAWVAPNDAFGGARADAPVAVLRLAWAVHYDAQGALAERVRSIEVWVDAGDGHLLGGDVVE